MGGGFKFVLRPLILQIEIGDTEKDVGGNEFGISVILGARPALESLR